MEENRQPTQTAEAPETGSDLDQELFDAIGKGKKRLRRRRVITVIVILAMVAAGIWAAVRYGKKKVSEQVGNMTAASSVTSYTVDTGSVNTTVSGSGLLADVDTEKIILPKGVKVEEMVVHAGDTVAEGDLLAIVDRSSVITAMNEIQTKIRELDVKIRGAANDTVSLNITTGVAGRVKMIYAQAGDDVAACMAEHGALALVSMDGFMAMEFPAGELKEGEEVKIVRVEGKAVKGKVDSVVGDTAIILVPDNGPRMDEEVTVVNAAGEELGTGILYIHNPMRITGYAGTIADVRVKENSHVYAGNTLFRLSNTAYSVNYESFLKERHQLEDDLLELIRMSRAGAVTAPFAGTVSSVEWKDPNAPADTGSGSGGGDSMGGMSGLTGLGGTGDTSGSSGSGTGSSSGDASGETKLLTLSPDEEMSLTITVDETDILALSVGQDAQVTVNSIGDIFLGRVTEINRNATASSGVTSYSAVITMPKDPRMMSGMSARAVVLIQGVAGAVLIPEDALHQTRDAAFVYTSYNDETGEFGDAVPVITGLSDGNMVEIVEGLSEGDTVYYTVVVDPWAMYYGSGGNASAGDAWVETDGGEGMVYDEGAIASDGDAEAADAAVSDAEDEMRELMGSIENAG